MKDSIEEALKQLTDQNGSEYLLNKPYDAYKELMRKKVTDERTAGMLLLTLLLRIPEAARRTEHASDLSDLIRERCGFLKKHADFLAGIYMELYSEENKKQWKKSKGSGLAEFMKSTLNVQWEGYAFWEYGSGGVSCRYNAEIELKPLEKVKTRKELKQLLKENDFVSCDSIRALFSNSLKERLDAEFEYYCTCDDYYEPVAEDFEAEDYTQTWCEENGFELISFEGNGSTGDFERTFRRGWY